MKKLSIILLGLFLLAGPAVATGFDPKNKPIEIIVPYPPGGANDKIARTVSEIFTDHGWKNVVINKAGSGGLIGTNFGAKATPDGHTLLIVATSTLQSNIIFKADGLTYTEKSFIPVAPLTDFGYVLAVRRDNPINTYKKFKFYVSANPDKFNLGFFNANTANVYRQWAKLDKLPEPNIVLYKGSSPQQLDLLGGHIPFIIDTFPAIAGQISAGKVRVIATFDRGSYELSKKLNPTDDIVNLSDQYPGVDINAWYAAWLPAGTPNSVVNEMSEVINAAFKTPQYQTKLEAQNAKFSGGTPLDLEKINKKTESAFKNIVK